MVDPFGNLMIDLFHFVALFAIGGSFVWSAADALPAMADRGAASIGPILMLFIYLELGAMAGIYFRTSHLPPRFSSRSHYRPDPHAAGGIQAHHHQPGVGILCIAGSILLLAIANLVERYGPSRYPSAQPGLPRLAEEE